jgi:hypothetical protein
MKQISFYYEGLSYHVQMNMQTGKGKDQHGNFWMLEGNNIVEYFGERSISLNETES